MLAKAMLCLSLFIIVSVYFVCVVSVVYILCFVICCVYLFELTAMLRLIVIGVM